ncbi:hypothetical protein RAA17_17680 [Komagataeibacter rhaeticus]|nr:hypothetical protein [Komagataeibacter rhaeticus]
MGTAVGGMIQAQAGFMVLCLVAIALPVSGMVLTVCQSAPPRLHDGSHAGVRWKDLIGHTWAWGLTLGLSAVGFAAISSFLVICYAARGGRAVAGRWPPSALAMWWPGWQAAAMSTAMTCGPWWARSC